MKYVLAGSFLIAVTVAAIYLAMRFIIYVMMVAPIALIMPSAHAEPPSRLEMFSRSAAPLAPVPGLPALRGTFNPHPPVQSQYVDRIGMLIATIDAAEHTAGPCYRNISPFPSLPVVLRNRRCSAPSTPTPTNNRAAPPATPAPIRPMIRSRVCSRLADHCAA